MLTIDGARLSGSGTIVRQSVLYAALTGQPVHVINARARRPRPGLAAQHLCAIEALRDLSGGSLEGASVGASEFIFRPGRPAAGTTFTWEIGSAGSAVVLAQALLPLLVFRSEASRVEVGGGVFQDRAPSALHMQHVLLPLLERMGVRATLEVIRPGYVPLGGGRIRLVVEPTRARLQPLILERTEPVACTWGIALSSHLSERRVSERMAEAARSALARAGHACEVQVTVDDRAAQAGAVLALFADRGSDSRLGIDRVGAQRRSAEAIGGWAARHLLDAIASGAAVDRFAADQLIPLAALAEGETRLRIEAATEHVVTNAWLAETILGCRVELDGTLLRVHGCGFWPTW